MSPASKLAHGTVSEEGVKRVAHKILTALVTFAVGVSLSLNWTLPLRSLAYCELARNAERYHGREVRVRARLLGTETPNGYVIFQLECDDVEALASWVEIAEARVSEPATVELREKMFAPKSEDTHREVEAVLTGRFDGEFSTGCWGPKFKISEAAIEQVLSVSEKPIPRTDDEVPLRLRH